MVVVINLLAHAGLNLESPKIVHNFAYQDPQEVMHSIYKRFGKGRKNYALGVSYGANNIANILAKEGSSSFIDAAVSFQPVIEMNKWPQQLKWSGLGVYNYSIAVYANLTVRNKPNTEMLKDTIRIKTGLDAETHPSPKTVVEWYDTLIAPFENYQNFGEFCKAASIHQRIKDIKKPCLFMCALDDPIVGS